VIDESYSVEGVITGTMRDPIELAPYAYIVTFPGSPTSPDGWVATGNMKAPTAADAADNLYNTHTPCPYGDIYVEVYTRSTDIIWDAVVTRGTRPDWMPSETDL